MTSMYSDILVVASLMSHLCVLFFKLCTVPAQNDVLFYPLLLPGKKQYISLMPIMKPVYDDPLKNASEESHGTGSPTSFTSPLLSFTTLKHCTSPVCASPAYTSLYSLMLLGAARHTWSLILHNQPVHLCDIQHQSGRRDNHLFHSECTLLRFEQLPDGKED